MQLHESPIRGVGDSPYHQCGESTTLRLTDTGSFLLKFNSQLPDSPMQGVDFWLWISPRIRSQNRGGSKGSVRDLCWPELCENIGKFGSLPCRFKERGWESFRGDIGHCGDYIANQAHCGLYQVPKIWCLRESVWVIQGSHKERRMAP
jgi:hypothetical protein